MNEFKEAKQVYEETPIPAELYQRVRAGIRQGKAKRVRRAWGRRLGTVAACFAVVVGALNLSPTMASAAADIPVLGGLFQILTVRSYTDENADRTLEVEQPAVTGSDFADAVSAEIQERVDAKTAEGEQLVAEYKDAFLATGGTQEEWEQHDITVSVSYDIKSQTDTVVSFLVESNVSFSNAYWERTYYNLDLAADKDLTLRDLLGPDWKRIANEAVRAGIDERSQDPANVYFDGSDGIEGFQSIRDDQPFYLNESGSPVVVFSKYEIAPGYMGMQEFEVGSLLPNDA